MAHFLIIRIFSLLFLTPWVQSLTYDCKNDLMPMEDNWIFSRLLIWCSNDKICAELYHQTKVNNMTVFKYLAMNSIYGYSSLDQLSNEILCSAQDTDVTKNLWLFKLKNSMKPKESGSTVSCPPNHELHIDHDQLTASCVCSFNAQCSTDTSKQDILAIELVLMIIILFAILVLQIFRIIQELNPIKGKTVAVDVLDKIY